MNILLLTASAATRDWLVAGCGSFDEAAEINCCGSLDLALRVLQVHDEVHMIVVDADLLDCEVVDAIKQLWRSCRSAVLVAAVSSPSETQMRDCVTAGALGYLPRTLNADTVGRVLAHVGDGGLWVPDLRVGRC
jgi:DNA-binding NarL/FixJ family response regulator